MTKNIETFLRNNMGYELIEIVAAAIMLIYLWLEYKASIWLWPVGVVIPLFYIYIYFVNKFYADMGINIYYLVASAYGWFRWWKSESALKRKSLRSGETAVLGAAIRYTPKTYYPSPRRSGPRGRCSRRERLIPIPGFFYPMVLRRIRGSVRVVVLEIVGTAVVPP